MRPLFDALALRLKSDSPHLNRLLNIGVGLMYLLGWLILVRLTHQPIWWSLPLLWAILPLVVMLKTRKFDFRIETLTPMVLAYGVLSLRLGIAILARVRGTSTGGLEVPQPYGNALDMKIFITLSLLWVWASQFGLVAEAFGYELNRERGLTLLAGGIFGLALVWGGLTYWDIHTRGVTASDPYAYVQMGYDLATRGTPEHHFPLTTLANQADVERYALVPIGYRVPDAEGNAATVWAVGYPALLAVAYRLIGEQGFYLLTPLLGVCSILATWALALEVLREWSRPERWLSGAIAAFILATSLLQLIWLATPMADIPAQLFSILALLMALKTMRDKPVQNAFLAGLCLGLAFAIRYTQVLLGVSLLLAFSFAYWRDKKTLLKVLVSAGIGAWLVASGILWYHQNAFGSPFKTGSEELNLFALQWLDDTAWRMLKQAFSQAEFLWLIPFIGAGVFALAREQRRTLLILGTGAGVLLLFHLPYQYLRLRDLLSLFPLLALAAGIGVVALMQAAEHYLQGRGRVLILLILAVVLWLRTYDTLQISSASFNNFGYLNRLQREAFDDLETMTPNDAIIATSLNAGAVHLYTERETVRPYEWETVEWRRFIEQAGNRPIYLLIDGFEMEPVFDSLPQLGYTVEKLGEVQLPYFHVGGGSTNQLIPLYRVRKNDE